MLPINAGKSFFFILSICVVAFVCLPSEQMYGLIWLTDLRSKMDSIDLLIMLTSAVCHDLDHMGYNNAYQVHKAHSLGFPSTETQTCIVVCCTSWS